MISVRFLWQSRIRPRYLPLALVAVFATGGLGAASALAQVVNNKYGQADKFRQLEEILPTPNDYRTASGAPGSRYWQQNVDYVIDVRIDEAQRVLHGSEAITYRNQSPDPLRYLWLQLDANIYSPDSEASQIRGGAMSDRTSLDQLHNMRVREAFDGGIKIEAVEDAAGDKLAFRIVKTMLRVDLPEPLEPGDSFAFRVDWHYNINNSDEVGGRTGFEYFEADDNCIFEMAQWFPRACAYTDVTGWQHKQFLGRGEFTLEFGNYEVRITVPEDHIVASTGVLQNGDDVLKDEWKSRLDEAGTSDRPVFVVTPEEALANQETKATGTKTWVFKAENVRDFAFATSRKFIWDAMGVPLAEKNVMAMSFYPNEGEPLWSRYSTQAVAHTLEVYSRYTFDYPYPVAISVNGPVGGMEYPMICFNGPRPQADGTYPARTKYGLISVVIHEVGHNWFPMIVNSDERQWTWMDEGLNTFMQFLAEQEWEEKYPSRRGAPANIVPFMTSTDQVPIMTNSESLLQFGSNAYAKPATALNILRETILGRELFDFAFKEYANRWKFRRPMPADFFRTMEDASGVDLDWFWRGWFYSTDHVDIRIGDVEEVSFDTGNPYIEKPKARSERDAEVPTVSEERNRELPKRTDRYPELRDFYNDYDELNITADDEEAYQRYMDGLSDEQRETLANLPFAWNVEFENVGGLVMPIILELQFEDGSSEIRRIPAQIWQQNNERVSKLFVTEKRIRAIVLDPRGETADADTANNHFPPQIGKRDVDMGTGFGGFRGRGGDNPMRRAEQQARESAEAEDASGESGADDTPTEESESDGGNG